MATVQFGGGVHDIRGSIGGTVFSRNRFCNYIRARITPVNPQSSRQNKIRACVQSLAPYWSNSLSQVNRDLWEVYADSIVRSNKVGAQMKLTGFNHFIRSNTIRLQSDDPQVDAGPTVLTLPPADPIFACEVDETNQQISVTFDPLLAWNIIDDAFMYVFMSAPKAVGTNFIGGPFRLAGAIDGDTASPPTSPQILTAPFQIAEGQALVCRARISEVDGRLSDPFQHKSAVIA
jgi:hypothetical protein